MVRDFAGNQRAFVPREKQKALERIRERRTGSEIDDRHFYRPLFVQRLHPDALAANPNLHKYMNEPGVRVFPLPTNLAIQNYLQQLTGGNITFIEGYFKALALALNGIEAVAFTGISVYRLCDELINYITVRRPSSIRIMYDADARDLGKGDKISARRTEDFFRSVDKFSAELAALCNKIGLECDIYFVMGNPDNPEKGVDDLIVTHGAEAVINDLNSFPKTSHLFTTPFFEGFKLSESTRRARLKNFFLNRNYRDWFEALPISPDKDLAKGFSYRKASYRVSSAGSLLDNTLTYSLENDPFAVNVPSSELNIKVFLDEARRKLDQLIEQHPRIAIQSATGSGKTTFFIEYAKRKRLPVVIAVPYVSLAKQIAKEHKAYALHGNYQPANVQKAAEADIVVCTYDTLRHVGDLWRRTLIIDEAHNLINQYGETYNYVQLFRAESLRRCIQLIPDARKTILLSGTMPDLLCNALNCYLVKVARSTNPRVRIFDIEADKNTSESLARCLLTRMHEIDWSLPKLNVVFWNNTDEMETLKEILVEMGLLKTEEIAIISRRHYNDGETDNLDDIITHQRVNPRIKLMMCTCLISEGINIKNTNVGRIFTVGLRCPDTFRQFIARFRNLTQVDVFSILEAETDLREEFFLPAELELETNLSIARIQATHNEKCAKYWEREYDDDELAYLDQIKQSTTYDFKSKLINLVYHENGTWQVDILHLLARIRGRKIATSNNCYFYTRLSEIGFEVLRVQGLQTPEPIQQAVTDTVETEKVAQKDFLQSLAEQLATDPTLLFNALYLLYQEKGNRHGMAELRALVGETISEHPVDAVAWLQLNRRRLNRKACKLILRRAKLHFFGIQEVAEAMSCSQAIWDQALRSLTFFFELQAYANRANRKRMQTGHKEEIRIKKGLAQHLATRAGELLSPRQLQAFIQPLISVPDPNPDPKASKPGTISVLALSSAQLIRLVSEITDAKITGSGRYRAVLLGQNWSPDHPPLFADQCSNLIANPLKILALSGG